MILKLLYWFTVDEFYFPLEFYLACFEMQLYVVLTINNRLAIANANCI